jgi:monoamine oxidase
MESIKDYLDIIKSGLHPHSKDPKKILIVGGGIAGLVAAYELLRAGHDPIILEAQTRIGGRILTLREQFADGLYAEAGAMRIPRSHALTMAYLDKFLLTLIPFKIPNEHAYYYIKGKKIRIAEYNQDPSRLDFPLEEHEQGKTISSMWENSLKPIVGRLKSDPEHGWDEISHRYDQYSVYEFLTEVNHWSEGAIEMFGLLYNQESLMNSSFMELLREEIGDYYTKMVQIRGGMDTLPNAFVPALRDRICFGIKMVAIDQTPNQVIIHCRTAATHHSLTADYAIITVPFPLLRHVEILKPFSYTKQRAIRQLHYDASAKIFIQTRRRFWEEDEGIYGGGSITDLAIRNIYYPEHGQETGRGVLLASYTWSEDAQRWGSIPPHERLIQAAENLAQIHPQILQNFEGGASKMWHDDEYAGGAFALFDPGQQTSLHQNIISPEGRIYFAGEHASLYHAWIQGAIESGLRAANQIHNLAV